MAPSKKPTMTGYYAAMEWLYDNKPHMMEYIASLGAPKNDRKCNRAMVVAGPNYAPRLYTNDQYLQDIGPAKAAGVLVHEWRYVLLNHHSESLNPKPQWTNANVLDHAHEAIINDSILLTGYELPEDGITGDKCGGQFYGYWTTDEGYRHMAEWMKPDKPEGSSGDDQEDADSSEDADNSEGDSESPSGGGSSGSQGQSSEDQASDDNNSEEGGSASAASDSSSGSAEPSNQESQDSDSGSGSESSESVDDAESGSSDSSSDDGDENSDDGASGSSDKLSEDDDSSLPDDADLESCNHGSYIEDENGELREMDEDELQEFVDTLNKIAAGVIAENPMPEDEKPSEADLDSIDQDVAAAIDPSRNDSYGRAGTTANEAEKVLSGGKLHLGWLKLLQKINPNVGKDDGGVNAKASYNWARTRRNTSLIRGVHLPTPGAPRDRGVGTKLKPVAMIVLDFSMSIDRRLAQAMKDMAQSIPTEHIEARCFTFSTQLVPFDYRSSSNHVASGGTDFTCIANEARKIEKETGEYPYVICLTDGEAWFEGYAHDASGRTSAAPTQVELDSRWLWVDVETEDDARAFFNGKAYPQVRRQKNRTALPYDRSKL